MAAIKRLAVILAGAAALAASAAAHRVPEAYVTLEDAELGGAVVTALTIKLEAYDAFIMAQKLTGREKVDLADGAILQRIGEQAVMALTLDQGAARYVGGEVSGEDVFIFLAAPPGVSVEDARFLSSVYRQWTNYVDDPRRPGGETVVFRPAGAEPRRHGLGHEH